MNDRTVARALALADLDPVALERYIRDCPTLSPDGYPLEDIADLIDEDDLYTPDSEVLAAEWDSEFAILAEDLEEL